MPVLDHKCYIVEFNYGTLIISKGNVSRHKKYYMYILDVDINKVFIYDYLNVSIDSTYLWHFRLNHKNKNKMIKMYKNGLIS